MKLADYGLTLARIRLSKGLSAYELSLRLGKDPSYIHKVENAKINISLKTILEIAEALDVPVRDFFTE